MTELEGLERDWELSNGTRLELNVAESDERLLVVVAGSVVAAGCHWFLELDERKFRIEGFLRYFEASQTILSIIQLHPYH